MGGGGGGVLRIKAHAVLSVWLREKLLQAGCRFDLIEHCVYRSDRRR